MNSIFFLALALALLAATSNAFMVPMIAPRMSMRVNAASPVEAVKKVSTLRAAQNKAPT